MRTSMDVSKRLEVLQKHLADGSGSAQVVAAPTASREASLPRFDIGVMEACLDDIASLKEEVYETFRHRPDLLPSSLEGLSKGRTLHSLTWRPSDNAQTVHIRKFEGFSLSDDLQMVTCRGAQRAGSTAIAVAAEGRVQPAQILRPRHQEIFLPWRAAGAGRPVIGVCFSSKQRMFSSTLASL